MRILFASLCAAAALAACEPQQAGAPSAPSDAGAPSAAAGGPPADAPAWVRDQWATLPDWTRAANDAGGGVIMFAPKSIRRNADAGTADIQIQVVFKEPRAYKTEDKATTTETFYFKELATYRFQCAQRTFTIADRQLIGTGDKVIATLAPAEPATWNPIDSSGAARVFEGPACKSD